MLILLVLCCQPAGMAQGMFQLTQKLLISKSIYEMVKDTETLPFDFVFFCTCVQDFPFD